MNAFKKIAFSCSILGRLRLPDLPPPKSYLRPAAAAAQPSALPAAETAAGSSPGPDRPVRACFHDPVGQEEGIAEAAVSPADRQDQQSCRRG